MSSQLTHAQPHKPTALKFEGKKKRPQVKAGEEYNQFGKTNRICISGRNAFLAKIFDFF